MSFAILSLLFSLTLAFAGGNKSDDKRGTDPDKELKEKILSLCDFNLSDALDNSTDPQLKGKRKKKNKKDKERVEKISDKSDKKSSGITIEQQLKTIVQDSQDPRSRIILDMLGNKYVSKAKQKLWVASLMVGNQDKKYTAKEEKDLEAFVKRVNARGYVVLHDANSAAAPIIARAAGEQSIAVGTQETPKAVRDQLKNFVQIDDPYIRLKAFAGYRVAFSPDSLTGLASLLNGDAKMHVPFVSSTFNSYLSDWKPKIDQPYLGFPSFTTPDKISLDSHPLGEAPKPFDPDVIIDDAFRDDLHKYLATANVILEGKEKISKETKGTNGALVIGSGQTPGSYKQDVYYIVKTLAGWGVPIVTGGSGGVMEIANAAAYDAGGISIGIPITGSGSLKGESLIPKEVHTLTVPTIGYSSRLPLLIDEKKLIVIAPGGTGTFQEIAVLLMKQAARIEHDTVLMFIGKRYYGPLVDGLKKYLPEEISRNMYVVDSSDDVVKVISKDLPKGAWKSWKEADYLKLRSNDPVTPRNENKEFKARWESDKSFSSKKDKGSDKSPDKSGIFGDWDWFGVE